MKNAIYNIMDYLDWRGDLSEQQDPYGEVDFLILSMLAYGTLENATTDLLGKTMEEIYPLAYPEGSKGLTSYELERHNIWEKASGTNRFGALVLKKHVEKFSIESEEQFAAMAFSSGRTGYLLYRGTDGTRVGWKEDINLAFDDEIPAEHDAVEFLESVKDDFDTIYTCGHSKGGILAVYSVFRSSPEAFDKVKDVWSFDGPGLQDHYAQDARWKPLSQKTHCYVPESSIIGMIYTALAAPAIVRSESIGILQYDSFNWHVLGKRFIHIEDTTLSSKFTDMTIKTFFEGCTKEERKVVVNTVYSIIELCSADENCGKTENTLRNLPKILSVMQKVPEQDRKIIWELVSVLRASSNKSLKTLIHEVRKEKA